MRIFLGCLLALCAVSASAQERSYRIEIGGKHIGYAHDVEQRTPEGVQVSYRTSIKISLLGSPSDIDYQAIGIYAPGASRPKRFAATLDAMNQQTTADSRFRGSKADVRIITDGKTEIRSVSLPQGTFVLEGNLISTWNPIFRSLGSFAGAKQVSVFSPLAAATVKMTFKRVGAASLRISGKTIPCDILEAITPQQRLRLWVSRQGRILVQLEEPLQKARIVLADKSAMQAVERAEVLSRIFAISDVILPPFGLLETLKAKVRAKVVVEKVSPASLRRPYQQFQGSVRGNVVEGVFAIRRYRYVPKQSLSLLQLTARAHKEGLGKYLKPEARIESDDPEIKALSRQLAQDAPDAWQAVSRLAGWVSKNIRYRITGASARQALRSKEGDCGPHTFLTIALCRAAGIPARMIGGAMYSPALGGSFGQHYWVEVWMGDDGWIPLDPTTGEIGTLSPAHITLWHEGAIGSLSVKVLGYTPETRPVRVNLPLRPLKLTVGQKERYRFLIAGSSIGEQTASVVCETTHPSGPAYEIAHGFDLKLPNGTAVKGSGTLIVLTSGKPVSFTLDADAAGQKQGLTCRFEGQKVKADTAISSMVVHRTLDVPEGAFLIATLEPDFSSKFHRLQILYP